VAAEVRPELERDRSTVHAINTGAFGRAEEAKLVDLLRERAEPLASLVAEEPRALQLLGAAAVVVLGHPEYYPKFGFSPAARFRLASEYDVPAEAFMALELRPGALRGGSGTVKYHPAFAEVEQ
jgi:putative acetyltransferase